jgi:hypothetical protein
MNSHYIRKSHKFGLELPQTVKEALALDAKNGYNVWYDAIGKEMKNVKVAFNILEEEQSLPLGYKFIPCHMIFDETWISLKKPVVLAEDTQ